MSLIVWLISRRYLYYNLRKCLFQYKRFSYVWKLWQKCNTQHNTAAIFAASFINKSERLTNQRKAEDVTINISGLWLHICEHGGRRRRGGKTGGKEHLATYFLMQVEFELYLLVRCLFVTWGRRRERGDGRSDLSRSPAVMKFAGFRKETHILNLLWSYGATPVSFFYRCFWCFLWPRFPRATLSTLALEILQIFTQLIALQIHFTSSPEICLRLEGAVEVNVLFIASSQKSE